MRISPRMGLYHVVTPAAPKSEKEKHPRPSRSNSPSPGLSYFQADFKTGTGSPPGLGAIIRQLRGAQSQLWARNSGRRPRRAQARAQPCPPPRQRRAATVPRRGPPQRLWREAGGTGAGKVAPRSARPQAGAAARTFPLRVLPGFPPSKDGGRRKGGKKIPSVREGARRPGWRGARGPRQLRAARPGRSDAPESRTEAARRERAEGSGVRAAAAAATAAATPGGRRALLHRGRAQRRRQRRPRAPGSPGRAGGLRRALGPRSPARPDPPPPAPPAAPRAQGSKRKAYLASRLRRPSPPGPRGRLLFGSPAPAA